MHWSVLEYGAHARCPRDDTLSLITRFDSLLFIASAFACDVYLPAHTQCRIWFHVLKPQPSFTLIACFHSIFCLVVSAGAFMLKPEPKRKCAPKLGLTQTRPQTVCSISCHGYVDAESAAGILRRRDSAHRQQLRGQLQAGECHTHAASN